MTDLPGALTTFSSNTQDPNWDRARKKRAQPYQARMDAYRRASRAWKKSGGLFGAFSWNKPPKPPAAPAELAPYVKAVGAGRLAKALPLPLRAAVAVGKPVLAAAGRKIARFATPRRMAITGALAGTGAVLVSAHAEAKRKNAEKRKALFGLRKFFDESKVSRAEDGKFASKGGGSKMAAGAPRPRHVASIYARGPNWEGDKEKPAYDWSRSVRPTKDMPFTLRQAYSQYRAKLDAAPPAAPKAAEEISLKAPDLADLPTTGRFKEISQKPQVPSTMSQAQYVDLARWAADRTKGLRDDIIARSIGRRDPGGHKNRIMIPEGTDPKDKDVRLAFNVARNLALHDVGLIGYDHAMTPETIQALQPYKDFIKHARRRMANTLREEAKPGTWAPFRREFGTPFKDGRTYHADTRAGHQKGEPKKAFARHMHFLKVAGEGGLAKSRPLSEAERKQRIDAARASAAKRSTQRMQATERMPSAPSRAYAAIPERHQNRQAAQNAVAAYDALRTKRAAIYNPGLVAREGVFTRAVPLSAAERKSVDAIDAELRAARPAAAKARTELRARDMRSELGPRWRYVGLAPEHWADPAEMPATRTSRAFTGTKRPKALPPTVPAPGIARAASRWGRGAKAAGAVAGAAALAGAAYGLARWRESRKAA